MEGSRAEWRIDDQLVRHHGIREWQNADDKDVRGQLDNAGVLGPQVRYDLHVPRRRDELSRDRRSFDAIAADSDECSNRASFNKREPWESDRDPELGTAGSGWREHD